MIPTPPYVDLPTARLAGMENLLVGAAGGLPQTAVQGDSRLASALFCWIIPTEETLVSCTASTSASQSRSAWECSSQDSAFMERILILWEFPTLFEASFSQEGEIG